MYAVRLKLSESLTQQNISKLAGAMDDIANSHSAMRQDNNPNGPWTLIWIMENKMSVEELCGRLAVKAALENIQSVQVSNDDWQIEELPEIDWLEETYKTLSPFSVGSFFIYGAHYDGDVPDDQIGLQIDAAMPTISPIAPVVFMTRTAPSASCVTLMSRPAMNRLLTLRLYRQRYGTQ